MLSRARSRSLTATLALVFAGTTLAVFALVGSYVYLALAHEVRTQDDLDIVLATRHTQPADRRARRYPRSTYA